MNYVWDRRKGRSNLTRHGIAFEDAIRIFDGPTLEKVDDRLTIGRFESTRSVSRTALRLRWFTRMFPSPNAESFRHGGQNGMKEQHTDKASAKGGTTDWKRLDSLRDKEIRSAIEAEPEARPTDANFWKKAKVTLPRPKQTVTIRLDADLLGWLRRQAGYQTRINAVLRTYMEAHKS